MSDEDDEMSRHAFGGSVEAFEQDLVSALVEDGLLACLAEGVWAGECVVIVVASLAAHGG